MATSVEWDVRTHIKKFRAQHGVHVLQINFNPRYDGNVDPLFYDLQSKDDNGEYHTAVLASLVLQTVLSLREDASPARVLDFASGTGRNAIALHRVGYTVTAADLSHDMVAELSRKEPNITSIAGEDMNETFGFLDNSFEGVVTMWANRFMRDVRHVAREVKRILVPEGVFVWPIFTEGPYWKLLSGSDQPTDPEGLAQVLQDIGFVDIEIIKPELTPWHAKELGITDTPYFLIGRKRKE